MSIKKHLNFLELLYKKKENIPCDFLIDEIDIDSYFFHNFLDVYVVQNRVLRLSKGLFRETYSIKEFTFDSHIAYQSYKFTAELHLTRKEILFILENLKLIKNRTIIFQRLFLFHIQLPSLLKFPSKVLYSSIFLRTFKVQNLA